MQFYTRKIFKAEPCDDGIWTKKLIDHYANDLVFGHLDSEQFLNKLSASFTLIKADPDNLPWNTYDICYRTWSRKEFKDVWIIKRDNKSEFFYKMFYEDFGGFEDRYICVLYAKGREFTEFTSNDNVFGCFLTYYQGIDKEDIDTLSDWCRAYVNSLDGLSMMLTTKFGENMLLNLTTIPIDHTLYLRQ